MRLSLSIGILVAVRAGAVPFTLAAEPARPLWTSSRISGTPEPPSPFRTAVAFPHLKFTDPVLIATAPGLDRLFVAELRGKVFSFPNDPDRRSADLFFDLAAHDPAESDLYGMTFHPDFARNRFVFLCYALKGEKPDGTRIVRFEVSGSDPPRIILESRKVVFTWLAGGHNGGCLEFGNDGLLYIATGDGVGPNPPDTKKTGQDVSDLLSSILRIDVDRPADGRTFSIPPDNPFRTLEGARPEIWAYGLRNPWKMTFDRETGELWAADVGWDLIEPVYRIEKGGNYGWSVTEGTHLVDPQGKRGPTPILPPIVEHGHSEAASLTGGYVYRGSKLPELRGAYIYGDWVTGKIWSLRTRSGKVPEHRELADTMIQIVAFGEDGRRELLISDYGNAARIHRIERNPEAGSPSRFPRMLSETGLFASVKDHVPAMGVIPYSIQSELWADGATAERFLALPGDAKIDPNNPFRWEFPAGTVLVRTVYRPPEGDEPLPSRRMETQLLHFEAGSWRPYTYAWNDEGTDAALVGAEGGSRAYRAGVAAKSRPRPWRFLSRTECTLCHYYQSGSVLGLNTPQINREIETGVERINLAAEFDRLGVFSRPLSAKREDLPRIADPRDTTADLSDRARSYLHVNCGHCHRENGGGLSPIHLPLPTRLKDTGAVDTRPAQGTFGIDGARIIAPGDPARSVLYYRMAKLGGGHMPRAGASRVDGMAVRLIRDWIASLPPPADGPPPERAPELSVTVSGGAGNDRTAAIRGLLASTRGALLLACELDGGAMASDARDEVLAAARSLAAGPVRDVFERYFPEEERSERLGDSADPAQILALKGDPARGREVFFSESGAQCKTCHRIAAVGGAVGPDLSQIGKKYGRGAILLHLLEPSREVAPEFLAYTAVTRSGEFHVGLLVERSVEETVLKDAQGKLQRILTLDLRSIEPRRESLMPELLLRDVTPQAAADLVAFLESLR